ncbi:MAG: thioredoxin family protein [Planctomycetales bacterium]|nr:thioredoxin family protein [Planctomycetales bacterium]
MTSRLVNAIWIALALACGTALAEEIRWAPDIATARQAALQYKVPTLIHFYGDNCLPCQVLEQNVYSKGEVVETLNKFYICVRVNASQERQVAAQYAVHSWPTDVFLSPDGKVLYQGVCRPNLADYLSTLQNVAVMNRDRNVMLAADQAQQAKQVTSQTMNYAQPVQADATAAQMAAQLPAGGARPSGNPNGPSFYAGDAQGRQQQLPASLAPNAGVSSGPMLAQNQPAVITTPTLSSSSQLAAAGQPQSLGASQGLPPSTTAGQILSPREQAATSQMLAYPSIPAANASPAADNAGWGNVASSNAAHSVDNPYFPQSPAAPPVAAAAPVAVAAARAAQPATAIGSAQLAAAPQFAAPPQASAASLSPAASGQPVTAMLASSTRAYPAVAAGANVPPAAGLAASPAQPRVSASTVAFQPRGSESLASPASQMPPTASPDSFGEQSSSVHPAIEGYCPVALKNEGVWKKGQSQFAVKHRGRIYWLSSQQAMTEFLAQPDRASPVLSGYDAMVFLNEGKLVDGSIQFGLHEQVSGSILLFSSAESKQAYERDYDRNAKALATLLHSAGVQVQ